MIYTKKGDKGETSLFGNRRVSKASLEISALGAVDELNSFLGILKAFSDNKDIRSFCQKSQKDLLIIGSIIAGSNLDFSKLKTISVEKVIDKLENKLPKLKHFVLPNGTKEASLIHFARSLVRRAEREVVALTETKSINREVTAYLNRLSDCLFVMARWENFRTKVKEEIWTTKKMLK